MHTAGNESGSTVAVVAIPAAAGYRRCRHGKPLWCATIDGDDDAAWVNRYGCLLYIRRTEDCDAIRDPLGGYL